MQNGSGPRLPNRLYDDGTDPMRVGKRPARQLPSAPPASKHSFVLSLYSIEFSFRLFFYQPIVSYSSLWLPIAAYGFLLLPIASYIIYLTHVHNTHIYIKRRQSYNFFLDYTNKISFFSQKYIVFMFFICFICVFQLPSVHFRRILSARRLCPLCGMTCREFPSSICRIVSGVLLPFEISSSRDIEVSVSFFLSAGLNPAFF